MRAPLIAPTGDLATLDPALANPTDTSETEPLSMIYPTLLTYSDLLALVPWAASDLPTISADGLTYVFTLPNGLHWSDGTPLDASTFAYSLNRTLSPCTASPSALLFSALKDAAVFSHERCGSDGKSIQGQVKSLIGDALVVVDPQILVIKLAQPDTAFLSALTLPGAAAQPEQLIAAYGGHQWTAHLADNGGIGGNLFAVKMWDHFRFLALIRNDSFWNTKPEAREIDFYLFQTLDDAYSAYTSGRLDIGMFPASAYQQAKKRSDFHQVPLLATDYLALNWRRKPFDDALARRAFALALNKSALAQQLGGSADNALGSGALIPNDHLIPQGDTIYNPSLVQSLPSNPAYNPAQAQQDISTYAIEACSGTITSCARVTLVTNDDPASLQLGQALVNAWQTALPGYPITTRSIAGCATLACDASKAPDAALYLTTQAAISPGTAQWFAPFAAGSADNPGLFNFPNVDALLRLASATQDTTSAIASYQQAETVLLNDVAAIPLFQRSQAYLVPSYMLNYTITALGYPALDMWQQVFFANYCCVP